jgi:cytoplasmic FMR1 interacting protein
MVRTMLESLISDRSKGKKTLRKDVDTKHLEAIETFHTNSFFWNYLLNFSGIYCFCCCLVDENKLILLFRYFKKVL